jgi:drug/metabolite transporter (DMT)-like permease
VRRRWPWVLLATLLGTTLGIGLQQAALAQLPVGQAMTLLATAPTMAVLLAPLDRDQPGFSGLLAALVAALGVWLVVR